jgi:hypothetical protein
MNIKKVLFLTSKTASTKLARPIHKFKPDLPDPPIKTGNNGQRPDDFGCPKDHRLEADNVLNCQ